jgi:hypothetical protein
MTTAKEVSMTDSGGSSEPETAPETTFAASRPELAS